MEVVNVLPDQRSAPRPFDNRRYRARRGPPMTALLWYLFAALGEIGGCFCFWAWLKLGKSPLWTIPGALALILFAIALTRIESPFAGRAYAAYGGIYILSSLGWLWAVENSPPDRWDLLGSALCLLGAAVIVLSPRR